MRTLIYIAFATLLSIQFTNAQSWPDYQESIPVSMISPTSGAGGFTLSISDNTLQLNGSAGFDSTILNLGKLMPLGASFDIPDTVLGNFQSGAQTLPYQVEIEDNWLKVTMLSYQPVTFIGINATVTLPPFDQDYEAPITVVPDTDENFVMSLKAQTEYFNNLYIWTPNTDDYLLKRDVVASISYVDGLGRDLQNIEIGYTPNSKDMIMHYDYDILGRTSHDYLPLPSDQNNGALANPVQVASDINTYYQNNFSEDLDGALNPFSQKTFDGSPLGRITRQGAPGSDWKVNLGNDDHSIKFEYGLNSYDLNNSNADNVRRFRVYHTSVNEEQTQLQPNGHYKANELYKTVTKDENWSSIQTHANDHTVHEFKNKKGQMVLKRTFNDNVPHDTYYVYDKYNNLSYVIPPKAADVIVNEITGNDSGIAWQSVNSWVDLVRVDSKFADGYNKKLEEYGDKDLRDTDIENEYGGQGGFALTAYKDGTFSIDIDFSVTAELTLKNGIIASFPKDFKIKDTDIGSYQGEGFIYRFFIKNSDFVIEGDGNILGLNQEYFTTENNVIEEIDTEVLQGLCYIYHYDYRNRLIEKKVPGKGWEHIVYNRIDQPILTQDKLLRESNTWLYTKYDIWGRVVYTGEYSHTPTTNTENSGRLDLQGIVDSEVDPVTYETQIPYGNTAIDNLNVEYTNNSFPSEGLTLLTINYYDNYFFSRPAVLNSTDAFGQTLATKVKTLSTGSKVRILGTDDWTTTVIRYDDRGRAILVATQNEYLNTVDIIKNKLDFTGQVLETESTHQKGSDTPIVTRDFYSYDHRNRLVAQTQQINNQAEELITSNNYDELGQLINKKVGGAVAAAPEDSNGLQQIDYLYNIRGWLQSINDGQLNNGDLFGFSIKYNTKTEASTTELFNGNISETHWITANDNLARKYCYTYDGLNRITEAEYHGGTLTFTNNVPGDILKPEKYDLKNVVYDKNGNLMGLQRYGIREGHGVGANTNFTTDIVDGLSYSYAPNSNTLMNVSDFADNNVLNGNEIDSGGFLETHLGNKYEYDLNGNLVKDLNKGITKIEYNHLNLPTLVEINGPFFTDDGHNGEIEYVYDATGTKLEKRVTELYSKSILSVVTTRYANGFVYLKNGNLEQPFKLSFFSQPEGYIQHDGQDYDYTYQYKDHLGNVRLTYADSDGNGSIDASTEIISEKNYYPFGMTHSGYNNVVSSNSNSVAQKFKYNGVELEQALGFKVNEMDFRQYDNALGRFMAVDPLAENYHNWTPYRFGFNNPNFYSDPLGLIEKSVLMDVFNRSSHGTKWYNDEFAGFYTNDGGYVGYTSNDKSFNSSPGSTTVLPEVTVKKDDPLSMQEAAWQIEMNIYNTSYYNHETIVDQRKPHNIRERWSFSDNFVANFSYNVANDLFQVVQVFDFDLIPGATNPLTGGKAFINIDGSANYKPTEGVVSTATFALPFGTGSKAYSSIAPKGLGYLKKFNAAQFSKTFKGSLSRLSPKNRGLLNRSLNKGVDAYNNQAANGMILLKSIWLDSDVD